MKVVETRNLYVSYRVKDSSSSNIPREAHWVSAYIIKQILRLITLKQLKNAVSTAELWTPDAVIRALSKKNKSGGSEGSQNQRNNRRQR